MWLFLLISCERVWKETVKSVLRLRKWPSKEMRSEPFFCVAESRERDEWEVKWRLALFSRERDRERERKREREREDAHVRLGLVRGKALKWELGSGVGPKVI